MKSSYCDEMFSLLENETDPKARMAIIKDVANRDAIEHKNDKDFKKAVKKEQKAQRKASAKAVDGKLAKRLKSNERAIRMMLTIDNNASISKVPVKPYNNGVVIEFMNGHHGWIYCMNEDVDAIVANIKDNIINGVTTEMFFNRYSNNTMLLYHNHSAIVMPHSIASVSKDPVWN